MAPKYLLHKKIIQEGVQRSPPAGAQEKGLQHQQDGKKVQQPPTDLYQDLCTLVRNWRFFGF